MKMKQNNPKRKETDPENNTEKRSGISGENSRQTILTCIGCPMGCAVTVRQNKQTGGILAVTGNTCRRGEQYARTEITNPRRTLTSIVSVSGGIHPVVPVRTREDVPKSKIFDCLDQVKKIQISAPVYSGQLLVSNLAGTGVDLIAVRDMPCSSENGK